MFNLFNIEPDFTDKLGKGPRRSTERECRAYCDWLRQRHGLPDLEFQGLEWGGGYQRGKDARICIGATYGKQTAAAIHEAGRWEDGEYIPGRSEPAQYENGAYSVLVPGATQPATVTMETLSDAGEVLASSTLPIEPKKGGVIWSREAVRAACGPIAKPRKAKAASEQPPIASPAPATEAIEPVAAPEGQIAPEALSEAPSGSEAVMEKSHDIAPDLLAEVLARVAALEARLDPPSAESEPAPIAQPARRTAAHERAIRRAWAERKARRVHRAAGETVARALQDELERVQRDLATLRPQYENAAKSRNSWKGEAERALDRERAERSKRRRSTMLARERGNKITTLQLRVENELGANLRMHESYANAEARNSSLTSAVKVRDAEIKRLKANMADPAHPERASDLARLRQERDQARNALAASAERAQRQEKALSDLADSFEAVVGRAARAEAELRRNGLAVAA